MGISGGPDIIQDGLILSLDANDKNSYPGLGTTWTDLSGYGNHCSLVNSATYSSAKGGGSIDLDGVDDLISVPKTLNGFTYNIHYDLSWTMEYWMYTDPYDASPQTYKSLYGSYNGCNWNVYKGNGQGIIIYSSTSSSTIYLTMGYGPNVSGCPDVSATWTNGEVGTSLWGLQNRWAHFVMTSDDGTTLKLYIDGVQIGPNKTVNFKNGQNRIDNTLPATTNYSLGGLTIGYHQVDFSIFKMYNRVLSASEIKQNYNTLKSRFNI